MIASPSIITGKLSNRQSTCKPVVMLCYFTDPQTAAHTQTIESTWWQVKRTLLETNSCHDGGLLLMFGEYLYRRRYHDEQHLCEISAALCSALPT